MIQIERKNTRKRKKDIVRDKYRELERTQEKKQQQEGGE